ncbi:MAG: pyridoxal phosphate-dependent aminotransferase [Anaerovoracaceae bacterium]
MKFSKRIEEMEYSPIRKLVPYLEEAKHKGVKVHEMHIGQPNVETPDEFFDGIKSYKDRIVKYTNSRGTVELRETFSRFYRKQGIYLSSEEILITYGGSEAIVFALSTVCDDGDEVLVLEPFYSNYDSFVKMTGAKMVPVRLKINNDYRMPKKEEIQKLITSKTKALLFSNPNNPTGTILTQEEMKIIKEIALQNDLYIIADEVYRQFVFDESFYKSFMNEAEIADKVILVDSISKHYSACGARIGILASKNKIFIEQALKLCQARLSVSTIEQVASTYLVNTIDKYILEVRETYKVRRDCICRCLHQIEGVKCIDPISTFYLLVELPVEDSDDFAEWILRNFSIAGETVSFAPGSGFYHGLTSGKSKARFSFCSSGVEEIKRAMNIIDEGLKLYKSECKAK